MGKVGRIVRISINLFICFTCVTFCAIEMTPLASATTYYVATNGDDSYNGLYPLYQGDFNGPFRTLNRAANKVVAGDTVQIRGGIYQEASTWSTSGTEVSSITITNYNDETAVIDGNNYTIPSNEYGVLFYIKGDWYRVSNLEFSHSHGPGIQVDADHCVLDNLYAYHNWVSGIIVRGSYCLVENCQVYNNSLQNEYFRPHEGTWGAGISIRENTCKYTTVRKCIVWDNWGEGISTVKTYNTKIEDNISYNNQTNFYICNTESTLFQRNLAYCTSDNMIDPYYPQSNILVGYEPGYSPQPSNNTLINNLSFGGDFNIYFLESSMENTLCAHNTLVNSDDSTRFNVRILSGNYSNARFINNIILQENSVNIIALSASGISFGYNNWSKTPPSNCQEIGDVMADPLLAKTGSTGPGLLTPAWFKILENSPAKDRAQVLSEVTEDFFKTPRGSCPDMGAIELTCEPLPLTASATGSPTAGQAPLTVNFTGSASGGTSPYTYSWTFGDGSSSTNRNPSHTYSSAGTYSVTLTITDSASSQASDSVAITVTSGTVTQNLSLSAATGGPAPGVGGTTDPAPGNHSYSQGSFVSLKAIPNTSYRFSLWDGNVPAADAYNRQITVNMDRDKSLSAHFCTRCGDANGNLNITPSDAQAAFDIFLKRISAPSQCQIENADVDCNGTITPADAQAIFNIFLGKAELPGDCSGKTRAMAAGIISIQKHPSATLLLIEDVQVNSDGYILVPIIIDNAMNMGAFGFDLSFPSDVLKFLSLESTEMTQSYEQLDAKVISSQPMNHKILRLGGYKTNEDQNPSYGVLLAIVFKVNEKFEDPIPLKIVATYDDIQNASVIDGIICPRFNSSIGDNERLGRNAKKKFSVKRHYF